VTVSGTFYETVNFECANLVMPDLIPAEDGIFARHPVFAWIPAFAGRTNLGIFNCQSNKIGYLNRNRVKLRSNTRRKRLRCAGDLIIRCSTTPWRGSMFGVHL